MITSFFSALVFVLISLTNPKRVLALSAIFYPSAGLDASSTSPQNLSATDAARLKDMDSALITTSDWPDGAYDENRYIEFSFSGNYVFGQDANISNFKITIGYRVSSTSLAAAKLKIYETDNNTWHEEPIGVPGTANVDSVFATNDLSAYLNSADDLNNLKVRFLAYDHSTTTTGFNQVNAEFSYTGSIGAASLPAAGNRFSVWLASIGLSLVVSGLILWKNQSKVTVKT